MDRFVGLITAGRRECWGSQTSGAGGHRNNAVPFVFRIDAVRRRTDCRVVEEQTLLCWPSPPHSAASRSYLSCRADASDRVRPQSLTALVGPLSLTRDTNGDGLADAVAARVIRPVDAHAVGDVGGRHQPRGASRLRNHGADAAAGSSATATSRSPPPSSSRFSSGGSNQLHPAARRREDASTSAALQPGPGPDRGRAAPLGGGDGLVVVGGDDDGTAERGRSSWPRGCRASGA